MEHCIPLARLSSSDVALAGGTGANLGELIAAGYSVPPGFVVTTGAYRAAAGDGWRTVPVEVVGAIEQAYAALGSPPVAVRSSATAEDLPGAAFAGQQARTSTSSARMPSSRRSGTAGRRCAPSEPWHTAGASGSPRRRSRWRSSCSGWPALTGPG